MPTLCETPDAAKIAYEKNGFCLARPIVSADLIEAVIPRMDAVMAGEYATGVDPIRAWNPGDDPNRIRKIDQAHLSDPAIYRLVTCPAIGEWAATITGARWVQVWATQMLYKPPSGQVTGNVGWHQDRQYWTTWWDEDSDVFTAWVAVGDVTEEMGPMRFAAGSHRWGFLNKGDFFGQDHDAQVADIPVPPGEVWREELGALPSGGVSFHQRTTFHGSGPNRSDAPRRAFAIHLRTENSHVAPGAEPGYYTTHLSDPAYCPVIFGNR